MGILLAASVALAGGIGAVARFILDDVIRTRVKTAIPFGTIVINVSGSLLLGLLAGVALNHQIPAGMQTAIGTGFLGGYTTFSTASVETVRLIQSGRTPRAVANALGTVVLALAAAGAGLGAGGML